MIIVDSSFNSKCKICGYPKIPIYDHSECSKELQKQGFGKKKKKKYVKSYSDIQCAYFKETGK